MPLPPLSQPRREWFTSDAAFKWFDLLWRKLGEEHGAAQVSISGNAATATAAATVPPLVEAGLPTVTQPDAPKGTVYEDTDTGKRYYKGESGWAEMAS